MGKRGILGVLALFLALLAAGVWSLVTGGGSRSRAAGRAELAPDHPVAREDASPLAPLAVPARQPSAAALVADAPPEPEAPVAPEGRPIEFVDLDDGVQVLVRVKASAEPIPGALVAFVDFGELETERRALLADPEDRDQAAARFGRLFRADENGLVTVPRSQAGLSGRNAFVEASSDDLWGRASLTVGVAEPVLLELVPDGDLAVRVVDQSGAPRPGVRTCLIARRDERSSPLVFGVTREPDGVALLRHVSSKMRSQGGASAFAALAIPLEESVELGCDPARLPEEPLELVLPETGSLEIVLVTPEGTPHEGLAWVRTGYRPLVPSRPSTWSRPAYTHVIRDGRLVLEVGPGLAFDFEVEGEDFVEFEAEGVGPRRAGELATVRLEIGRSASTVAARLLADGEPLPDARVVVFQEIGYVGGARQGREDRERTDAGGRISFPVLPPEDPARRLTFEFSTRHDGEELSAELVLGPELAPGENELGDLALEPRPLLLAGRIVDDAGNPVPGASVRLYARVADPESGTGTSWERLRAAGAEAGRDGRFEARGRSSAAVIGVTPAREGFTAGERAEFPRGTRDATVVMSAGGSIAGRVLVDPSIGTRTVSVFVRSELAERNAGTQHKQVDPDTGAFELKGLKPGRYTLLATVGMNEEVARAEGLLVEAGRTVRDPRFDPLDLRGELSVWRVRARCADEFPVESFQVLIKDEKGGYRGSSQGSRGDRPLTLITSRPALDLLVRANEHRDLELLGVKNDLDVLLDAGLRVELTLEGVTGLDPGLSIAASLVGGARSGRPESQTWVQFDAAGVARFRVGVPGTYQVALQLLEGESLSVDIEHEKLSIEVLDRSEPQQIRLSVPRERIEATIEQLPTLRTQALKELGY